MPTSCNLCQNNRAMREISSLSLHSPAATREEWISNTKILEVLNLSPWRLIFYLGPVDPLIQGLLFIAAAPLEFFDVCGKMIFSALPPENETYKASALVNLALFSVGIHKFFSRLISNLSDR